MTIAIDVFGKDANFNYNKDSTVCSHIHMLRKKLDDYYNNESRNDKVRLIISIGHYEVQYVSVKDEKRNHYQWIISSKKYLKIVAI